MFQKYFLLLSFLLLNLTLNAQLTAPADTLTGDTLAANFEAPEDSSETHEITLFLMPTMLPLDWSSPSALYKSMLQTYLKTIGLKDNYLLGHLAVRLNTPLLDKPLFTAQSSLKWQERIDMVLKQRVGFGILGAALQGRIEPSEEIQHKLQVYKNRNKLSYITYRVNRTAMKRMLMFYEQYQQKITDDYAASDFYGGAFWPRYHNEGAGCSAFGFALLDVAGVLPEEASDWKVEVKIPMNIIGGKFNKGKKIRNRTIRRTTSWYTGSGAKNVDYADYFVWDPSIMYNWVRDLHSHQDSAVYRLTEYDGIPGLYKDVRDIQVDLKSPIFIQRPDSNIFINHYYQRLNLQKN
ncbi:MAG: hypothetical protein PHU68_03135 [Paludibacter sp.]|nr:hypothetical protein [Paludibacter sp.]